MAETFKFTDERFADIQMLRYRLDGFEDLTLKQKLYIYYLAKATLCGRDIVTDQFGRHNLLIRMTLEAVYENFMGDRTSHDFQSMTVYLKRVWFSNGIHHHYWMREVCPRLLRAILHRSRTSGRSRQAAACRRTDRGQPLG